MWTLAPQDQRDVRAAHVQNHAERTVRMRLELAHIIEHVERCRIHRWQLPLEVTGNLSSVLRRA